MTPDLQIACEVVFQEHKQSPEPIKWNRDSFRGRLSFGLCEMAKNTLLKKKVIIQAEHSKKVITHLNPDVVGAGTFDEAVEMVGKKPAIDVVLIPVLKAVNGNASDINTAKIKTVDPSAPHIYISKAPAIPAQRTASTGVVTVAGLTSKSQSSAGIYVSKISSVESIQDDDLAVVSHTKPIQERKLVAIKPEPRAQYGKWWVRPVFLYLVWPVCGAAGGVLLSLLMNFAYTQIFLHAK